MRDDVVAYKNLEIMVDTFCDLAAKQPKRGIPKNLDEVLSILVESSNEKKDEVSARRIKWLMMAALLHRAYNFAKSDPTLLDGLSELWIYLLRGSLILHALLRNNIIWSPDEKLIFLEVIDAKGGFLCTYDFVMPQELRSNSKIIEFYRETRAANFDYTKL